MSVMGRTGMFPSKLHLRRFGGKDTCGLLIDEETRVEPMSEARLEALVESDWFRRRRPEQLRDADAG